VSVWLLILAGAAGTVAMRAAGPLSIGGRRLPVAAERVIALAAPALLGALVAYQSLASPEGDPTPDERLVGLLAAAVALALRASMLIVVASAALATALSLQV
jgi:branched-subunit amino acid transport protein